jgi:hypothetical protein
MSLRSMSMLVATTLMTVTMFSAAAPSMAEGKRIIRFGYLDHPGSALCQIAAEKGHFRKEGLQVELVRFGDSFKGLAALEEGGIDIGAFSVGEGLRAIASGKRFRIIAGGGTPVHGNLLAELDDTLQAEAESRGIVVLIPATWPIAEKGTLIQLTEALIRAYRTHEQKSHEASQTSANRLHRAVHFDPNPDYWRMERIWSLLGLQDASMKRNFLANHVYEEIYCDALDRLLDDSADDPVFKDLSRKAVCTPNCCPANSGKLSTIQGGVTQ